MTGLTIAQEAPAIVEETPTIIDTAHHLMHYAALGVGVIGVAVLLWGVAVSAVILLRAEWRRLRGQDPKPVQEQLRSALGLYLLLGLEFLVAADIIETIIAPSLEALAVLGAIVLIRTIISFSLNWELRQHTAGEAD